MRATQTGFYRFLSSKCYSNWDVVLFEQGRWLENINTFPGLSLGMHKSQSRMGLLITELTDLIAIPLKIAYHRVECISQVRITPHSELHPIESLPVPSRLKDLQLTAETSSSTHLRVHSWSPA